MKQAAGQVRSSGRWWVWAVPLVLAGLIGSWCVVSALDKLSPDVLCSRSEVHHGAKIRIYRGDRQCVRFEAPRVLRGVWINEFEGSQFFGSASGLDEVAGRPDRVWLSFDEKSKTPPELKRMPNGGAPWPDGHAYLIQFLGRPAHDMHRRSCFNGYGHMGCSAGIVLTDRVDSLIDLGPAH